ncbi:signal peptidase II [Cellulomonas gilvus]|uniref:Lipoprotein signal peptidase n=1 Tax=Cellulomonas gilvus (strain ATCC 13127 / NRRL B-14078) TaxID=593907 RepID=F7ZZ71_CELGA|nr:signal peptidase II [Cellulomonas gilvus]AEI12487.1 lipoprotein signal peptidase [Cellulomonas gilvus ATCC 13127]
MPTPDESPLPATTGSPESPEDAAVKHRDAAAGSDVPATRRRRLLTILVGLTAVVLVLDQATKAWALTSLDGARREVLGDWLGLQLVFNPGAALSIATGMTWVLTLVAIGVVVVVARAARRIGSTMWAVALGLLLGGALGNLVDRLFRSPGVARGHVIDFIAYADWFVGNVADIAIVVAAGLIVLTVLRGVRIDGTRETEDSGDAAATPAAAPRGGASDA